MTEVVAKAGVPFESSYLNEYPNTGALGWPYTCTLVRSEIYAFLAVAS